MQHELTEGGTWMEPVIPTGSRTVDHDIPGLSVGVAEYDQGPTGCTVLVFDQLMRTAVDVRGGSPMVFNAGARAVEAVCLAGGSSMGVAATVGVLEALYESRGSDPLRLPSVTGGVIYDFAPPGRTGVYADAALGRAALAAADGGSVPVGPVGAGRSATCGKLGIQGWAEPGGQGAAFMSLGQLHVLVVVVVNALGVVTDRDGSVVRGNRDPATGLRQTLTADQMIHGTKRQHQRLGGSVSEATTLTVVATNARLPARDVTQLARQVHASIARAIHPVHAMGDGDTLWFLTSNTTTDQSIVPAALGAAAAELAWDAVLTSFDP